MPTSNPPTAETHPPVIAPIAPEHEAIRSRMDRFFPEPFTRLLHEPILRLVREPFTADVLAHPCAWSPPVEIAETDEELTVTAELPGLDRQDVRVAFDDGVLIIAGEKEEEREKASRRFHLWERAYGSFERAFAVPVAVDATGVTADMGDGVLTVHLPKAATETTPARHIEIRGASREK